jgi:hypothetical protein
MRKPLENSGDLTAEIAEDAEKKRREKNSTALDSNAKL